MSDRTQAKEIYDAWRNVAGTLARQTDWLNCLFNAVVEGGTGQTAHEFLALVDRARASGDGQYFLQSVPYRQDETPSDTLLPLNDQFGCLFRSTPSRTPIRIRSQAEFFTECPISNWRAIAWKWIDESGPFPKILAFASSRTVKVRDQPTWASNREREMPFCAKFVALLDRPLQEGVISSRYLSHFNRFKARLARDGDEKLKGNPIKRLHSEVTLFQSERSGAGFHTLVGRVFEVVFSERLTCLGSEHPVQAGHGRVDFVYRNEDSSGFFWRLATLHVKRVPYVFVECKDYPRSRIGNDELMQLAGRLSQDRGEFGLLVVSRNLGQTERLTLLGKCREIARDRRGWIVVLDRSDLLTLIYAHLHDDSSLDDFMDEHLRLLAF